MADVNGLKLTNDAFGHLAGDLLLKTIANVMKSQTIRMITDSLFEKDESEKKHCERVSAYCKNLAQALNMSKEAINTLELAGMFHDIGKIGIDENILKKRGKLDVSDLNEIRRHPEIGYQILRSSSEFAHVADYVLSHHERPDGKGYPREVSDPAIPYESKIIAVAEAYDGMVNLSIYKDAVSEDQAIRILQENSGSEFDPGVVEAFVVKVLGGGPKEAPFK